MANGHVSAAVLGKVLDDLTPRRVQQLAQEGVIPKADRGKYPLVPCVQGYIRYLKDRAEGRRVVSELDQARLEKEQLEVRRRQLELAQTEGGLISIDDHRSVVEKISGAFRAAVLAIPGAWGARIVGLETPAQATEVMRECSEQILRDMVRFADELEAAAAAVDDLPEDFPGRRALEKASITTWSELRALDDLTTVPGIGPKLSEKIIARMESAA